MTGYKDGDVFKTHPLFSKEPSIRINLYYDDLEVANGLGSKATIHELGVIYFVLDNLPRKINSQLHNIYLTLLFHSQDLKTISFDTILRPLINDLKLLEERE
jgi:hypothetical protein